MGKLTNVFSNLWRRPAVSTATEASPGTDSPAAAPAPPPRASNAVPRAAETAWWWESFEPDPYTYTMIEGIDSQSTCQRLEAAIRDQSLTMIDIPDNIYSCLNILNNPDFHYGEVEVLIARSPVLAGNIIKMANSSLYSRGMSISNLSVALPRLGPGKIKAILYFASCERQLSNHPVYAAVATRVVSHSYVVAQIASYLSFRYYPDSDKAFLAGLLHDVGKLAILKELTENYQLPDVPDPQVLREESYGAILPDFHEAVGAMVASHWSLSQEIIDAIGMHHHLSEGVSEDGDLGTYLARVIHVSDLLARMLGHGRQIEPVNLPELQACRDLVIHWDEDVASFFNAIPSVLLESD